MAYRMARLGEHATNVRIDLGITPVGVDPCPGSLGFTMFDRTS